MVQIGIFGKRLSSVLKLSAIALFSGNSGEFDLKSYLTHNSDHPFYEQTFNMCLLSADWGKLSARLFPTLIVQKCSTCCSRLTSNAGFPQMKLGTLPLSESSLKVPFKAQPKVVLVELGSSSPSLLASRKRSLWDVLANKQHNLSLAISNLLWCKKVANLTYISVSKCKHHKRRCKHNMCQGDEKVTAMIYITRNHIVLQLHKTCA